MLKMNNKGFMLLEIIICLAITSMMVGVCLPIIYQLKLEQKLISNRIDIHHELYNKVQLVEKDDLPIVTTETIDNLDIKLSIYFEEDLIIGQGVWTNEKNQIETAIVYFQMQE